MDDLLIDEYLRSQGLLLPGHLTSAFWNALRTKGFVFLAGLTGTGKTKLAKEIAKMFYFATESGKNSQRTNSYSDYKSISVVPSRTWLALNESGVMVWSLPYKDMDRIIPRGISKIKCLLVIGELVLNCHINIKMHTRSKTLVYNMLLDNSHEVKTIIDFILKNKLITTKDLNRFKKVPRRSKRKLPLVFDLLVKKDNNNIIICLESIKNKDTDKSWEYGINSIEIKKDSDLNKNDSTTIIYKEITHFLSVRPDWTDKTELLGWVNPLAGENEPKFKKGLILDFLLQAIKDYRQNKENARPHFLILDEMNLAHIEYYFADFLSVLESGRTEEGKSPNFSEDSEKKDPYWKNYDWSAPGWTRETIKLHNDKGITNIPMETPLPPNLYIIGTLNTDETTKSLSPKVLDRGFVLEFRDVDMENYPPEVKGNASAEKPNDLGTLTNELKKPFNNNQENSLFLSHTGNKAVLNQKVKEFKDNSKKFWDDLKTLNDLLKDHDLHFGYRIIDEIGLFVLAAESSEVAEMKPAEAFDMAVCCKVLPKFYGTRAKLEKALWKVVAWAVKGVSDTWKKAYDKDQATVKSNFIKMASELDEGELVKSFLDNTKNESDNNEPNKFLYPHTGLKALRMLRDLYEEGFASYL